MVVVTGCDEADVLVGNCDGEETITNGLLFDCGIGFCTTEFVGANS